MPSKPGDIWSGKEKDEGAKIYCITKELVIADLSFCCYSCFRTVTPDDNCNNGICFKTFCMSNQLCIASRYFDYPNENSFRWCSCNKLMTMYL